MAADVDAELTFLDAAAATGPLTNYLDIDPPPGAPRTYPTATHRVRIEDARAQRPTLAVNGVALARHRDGVLADFRDEAEIAARYYPALARLVRDLTGARRAVVFDHTFRSSALTVRSPSGIDTAVTRVHNDYTPASGPARTREMLARFAPDLDPHAALRGRYAIFNVWRPINGPVEQMPLAVCDLATMRPEDFVPCTLRWKHRTGYVSAVRHRPAHRWLYAPGMDVDEALVFKCFDSQRDANGTWANAHSAFADPHTPAGARVRESIEARVIALFEGP